MLSIFKFPKISKDKRHLLVFLDFLGVLIGLGCLFIGFIFFITMVEYFGVAYLKGQLYWDESVLWWQPFFVSFFALFFLVAGIIMPRFIINFTEDIHKLDTNV